MCRSFRHVPISGNTTARSDKPFKCASNRLLRRKNNQIINHEIKTKNIDELDDMTLYNRKDLCDIWDSPKDGKGYYLGSRLFGFRYFILEDLLEILRK